MKRFRNILVVAPGGVDATEALRAADRLAVANEATITIFDAVTPVRAPRTRRLGDHNVDHVQKLIEDARRTELEEMADSLSVPFSIQVATGALFIEAIHRVLASAHDLVVIPPDQKRGSRGLARATTTMHLLRKCPVPVWVHQPEAPGRNDVLAAVGPFSDGEATELDHTILTLASSLASRLGGGLHVVHAWNLEGESLLRRGRVHLSANEVDGLVHEEQIMAQLALEKLLVDTGLYGKDGVSLHLLKGSGAAVIPDLAERLTPEVVVMGTVARSGIAGLLIGNTAETILTTIDADVLAVKPAGFISPLQ